MNKKQKEEYLIQISQLLSAYVIHRKYLDELSELLNRTLKGKEDQFFPLFLTQLNNVLEYRNNVDHIDANELLRNVSGPYYSIHLQRKEFNIRMLVRIDKDIYLLCLFDEKKWKKIDRLFHTYKRYA